MKNSSSAMRVTRFILSGSLAATAEFSSFLVCTHIFSMTLPVSQSISFLFGLTVSYLLNKFWVFKSKGRVKDELPKYVILAVLNLLLSNVLIVLLHTAGFVAWLAKLIVMASVASWNFLIFQKIIFGVTSSRRDG